MSSKSPLIVQRYPRRLNTTPTAKNTFTNNLLAFRTKTPLSNIKNTETAYINPLTNYKAEAPIVNRLKRNASNLPTKLTEKKIIMRSKTPMVLTSPRPLTEEKDSIYSGSTSDYTIGSIIGCGSYAVVRDSYSNLTKNRFAVKTYEKTKISDPQKRKNVRNEIKIMQNLKHPNIIGIKEAIDSPKHIHIVMEHIDGLSLHSYIKRKTNRQIPEDEARQLFTQVVRAVNYCHNLKIIHRDIKLENILLDGAKSIKLIDFGFSTNVFDEKIKMFCGTPSYMAPEIVSKREYFGGPADVWALGVLLFVMLSGVFPFAGNSDREVYRKILIGSFEIPTVVAPQARLLIKRMIQIDPYKRPTCQQILEDPWMNPNKENL
ncbi:unnamed protein product [Blepharisma stoltei]|uniref:Protein kinase domain-containing protein n=1 Tax=Blepharisma stoltei TaxID=1481888 RepID=A0AAU9IYV8_9CILI|nr:unnamed protein product [Blepharisma stoltei]